MASRYHFFSWTIAMLLYLGTGADAVDFSGSEDSLDIFEGLDPTYTDIIAGERTEHSIPDINKDAGMLGDMMMSQVAARSAARDPTYHWKSPIPIKFSEELSLLTRTSIMEGIREFEMLTCITFVNHTTEEDFIHIKPLGGCWSWVGKVGGEQELSIGSYCWYMDIVIHEIMHALGFVHEQSRADRDLYLRILFENIDENRAHNFQKGDYLNLDDQRVPYDYYSVMHYPGNAFANPGTLSMMTLNPYFQYVIGRRQGFSEGDLTKINRLYSCSDTSRYSYVCDFEDPDVCGYVINHYVGWTRQQADVTSVDVTSSDTLYPRSDATFGENGKGHFMFFNGSLASEEVMWSPYFISKVEKQCLQFSYYMDRAVNSTAYIRVAYGKFNTSKGAVYNEDITDVGVVSNYVPRTWNVYRRTIQAPSDYKLLLYATAGPDDVIAIDDVSVVDRACDTSYFTIHNVSGVWDQYPNGTGFYSPLMYTEDGYGFVMSVYPNGHSRAYSGYTSMFFHLVHTPNVDSLSWPFHNRTVKITMLDPRTDVTKQANRFVNFETSPDGGQALEKPLHGTINGGLGYFNLFFIPEVMADYAKHNSLTFSIDVPVPSQLRELSPADDGTFPSQTETTPETTPVTNSTATNITVTTVSTNSSTETTTNGETSPQPTVRMTQPPTTSGVSSFSSSITCLSMLLLMFNALDVLL